MTRAIALVCAFICAACGLVSSALAQSNYPTRQVRIIIGYGPAGPSDVIARIAAEAMSQQLGQPFVVENRPGANGLLAARAVKIAEPDGYTLFSGSVSTYSPIYMKDGMLTPKELAPVSGTATIDWFIYARSDLGINNLKDFAAYVKAKKTKLRLGVPGTTNAMYAVAIARALGLDHNEVFDIIPYKTSDQVLTSLMRNDTQMTAGVYTGNETLVTNGTMKVIAVLSPQRSSLWPNFPTATEQGVPVVQRSRHAIWAPLKTSPEIIAKLNRAINEGMRQPATVERTRKLAMDPGGTTPEELLRVSEEELRFNGEFAKILGIQPE